MWDELTVNRRSAHYGMPVYRSILFRARHRNRAIVGAQSEQISVNQADRGIFSGAQPHSAFRHCIQHGLNIRWRTSNHLKNIARRSLLLQCFSEFLEQANILDGYHRLISKRLKKFDFRGGEGAYFSATCAKIANEFPCLRSGHIQDTAPAASGTYRREIVLRAAVRNMERPMLAYPAILWLINTDFDACNGYGTKMSSHNHTCHPRGVAAPRHQSHKLARRSQRWHQGLAARQSASG